MTCARVLPVVAALLLCVAAGWPRAAAAAPPSPAAGPAARAKALLAKMNLTEKITLMHGGPGVNPHYTGGTAAVPRLGIPETRSNDGRQGFRSNSGSKGATAWPCALAVTSTWNTSAFQAFGRAMGVEFAAKGANVALTPMLILARVDRGGRNFESVGEDPELASAMGAGEITGLQSVPGVMANADDFVMNNQETARGTISVTVDERTTWELYYRPYEAAVDAGVASIMCSYNQVNGTHACENAKTLHTDLKGRMGFDGFVLSDWGGTHSTVASALAGLDQEMPGDSYFGAALVQAVQAGKVPESRIDDAALRVLTPMFRAGLFDAPPAGNWSANVTSAAHAALARELAAQGTVLLKNDPSRGVLPLQWAALTHGGVAVIGDEADVDPLCCGTGSGNVNPPYVVSPLQGIRGAVARAGAAKTVPVSYTPTTAITLSQWWSALRQDHFLDATCLECFGLYVLERVEAQVYATIELCRADAVVVVAAAAPAAPGAADQDAARASPDLAGAASAQCANLTLWYNSKESKNTVTTNAFPPGAGYKPVRVVGAIAVASAAASSSPSSSAAPAVDGWGDGVVTVASRTTGEALVPLELWHNAASDDYFTLATAASRAEASGKGYTRVGTLGMVGAAEGNLTYGAAVKAAAAAEVAIVCVGALSGEGHDRPSLNVSAYDNGLIEAVAAANPRTVVVMHNPGAVVTPWAEDVAALLAAYFPGQEMGNALADVLDGSVNPSGKLPLTFPMRDQDTPLRTPAQYPGVDGVVTYSERLQVGYRWFDAAGVAPRFAFGFGLSYTTFAFSGLSVTPAAGGAGAAASGGDAASAATGAAARGGDDDAGVEARSGCQGSGVRCGDPSGLPASWLVNVSVTNTGHVAGAEVAQLYVSYPAVAGEPPRQLRGFAKLALAPAETRQASMRLTMRDLAVWDTPSSDWLVHAGAYQVHVGPSSRTLPLSATINVTATLSLAAAAAGGGASVGA